jgi:hypothetical protein
MVCPHVSQTMEIVGLGSAFLFGRFLLYSLMASRHRSHRQPLATYFEIVPCSYGMVTTVCGHQLLFGFEEHLTFIATAVLVAWGPPGDLADWASVT